MRNNPCYPSKYNYVGVATIVKMAEVCLPILRRILQNIENLDNISTVPDEFLDVLVVSLEFVYQELIYSETIHAAQPFVSDSIVSVGRCLRILNLALELKMMAAYQFGVHTIHTGLVGRPSYVISHQQLSFLVDNQFTVPQIADILGISTRTVRRRMDEYDITINSQYSTISDLELDRIVHEIQIQFPTCGNRQMQGHLLSRGYRVQQSRVRESQRRVDPNGVIARHLSVINRRQYSVSGPRSLYHMDGYHKLIRLATCTFT